MKIELDSEGKLECPYCEFDYLHYDKIEVFERGEDDNQGLHVTVQDGLATTDLDISANPSLRRHGVSIRFWCEGCKEKPLLTIAQHKGNTYLEFAKSS